MAKSLLWQIIRRQTSRSPATPTPTSTPVEKDIPRTRPERVTINAQSSAPTCLNNLPIDIFLSIMEHLPGHAIATLALTNRAMFGVVTEFANPFQRLRLPAMQYERTKFLLLCFDKHHPNELVCYNCGVFHPRWYHRSEENEPLEDAPCLRQTRQVAEAWVPNVPSGLGFSWPDFHKVMRGFRLSPEYGNTCLMNHNVVKSAHSWSFDSFALAADDRLLVRQRHYISVCGFRRYPSTHCYPISWVCPHVDINGTTYHSIYQDLRRASKAARDRGSNLAQNFTPKIHRCTCCPTEYIVEVRPRSLVVGRMRSFMSREKYVVFITSYKDLGACMSPDEPEFVAMSSCCSEPHVRNPLSESNAWQKPQYQQAPWPTLDLTHMEPISARFERQFSLHQTSSTVQDDKAGSSDG
ncbi:hypothetical protein K504DRAFT_504064 [Pleomassaria siparia CBS 279.74]|uniref:F-box domain-containing protein n=1 Tax=Pleomassaria siparia CBS 279.74 TaxID=1314801 RepID=A0A6G1K5W8_9PLEO|nr:hypothetical protein K504DRAFT_504064 [Pleomassaria siparia CBS 279.74]